MTFSRAFCLAVTACLVAGAAVPVHAGVADTPLPTFADGKPGQLAVMLPAVVKDNNLRTYVVCTNLGATPVDVGLEVFDQGGVRGNSVAAGNGALLDVAAGRTVTFSTGATVVMHEEVVVNLEPPVTVLGQGSGRVVTTGLQVACTAYAVDRLHQIRDPRRLPERPPTIAVLPVQPACTPAACADADPCTVDACDHAGVCTHTVVADGAPCDDGNACTTGEACFADRCIGSPVSCDDGNVCTTDTCDPASGCQHVPVPGCSTTTTVSTTTTSTSTSSTTSSTAATTSTTSTSSSTSISSSTSTTASTSSSSTTTSTSSSTTTSSTVKVPTTTSTTLATTTSTAKTTTTTTSVTSTTAATSSSTTTTSSSTTTSLAPPPPATTTTLPSGPPCVVGTSSGCDDGDPCTVDTCTATGCLHDPASGFAAIVCALPDAGFRIGPCAGQQIPSSVTRLMDQSRSLIGRATPGGRVKQTRRLLLKAAKALRTAAKQAIIAGKHGRLSPACVDALRSPLQEAATRAARLAAAL